MFRRPAFRFLLPSRSGLRSALPWAVLVISVACTLMAWQMLRTESRERGLRAFEIRAQRLSDALQGKLRDIELDLRGNAALLAVNGPTSPRAWRESIDAMGLLSAYPGLEAVGYAITEARTAISRLVHTGQDEHNLALGFDLFTVSTLREALAPLAQGYHQTAFLHPVPWLRGDPDRRVLWLAQSVRLSAGPHAQPVRGFEWALLSMERLLKSLTDATYENIDIQLRAGDGPPPGALIYDSDGNPETPLDPLASTAHRTVQIATGGTPLNLSFAIGADYFDEFHSAKAYYALVGGLTISTLLFLIAWYGATIAQRAEELARQMSSAHVRLQARLQRIIGTAMDAIITVDEHQNITMFNHAAETIFGYRAEEIVGQSLDRLMPEALRARHREHVQRFGETGDTARAMGAEFTVVGLRANGEQFPVDASISRLKEDDHLLFTVILRDVTRRRQSEEALARTQENLRQSNERLRSLSTHAESAREAERIRIAREIHDDLAATLTGIKMDLSAARDALHGDPGRAEARLRASLGLMDAAVVTTRRIINDLRPSILDNLGVWAAIEWQTDETARRAGIQCAATIDPALEDVQVPPAVSTALFRIVQEALNNVWRHAQARNATVRCSLQGEQLEVLISDDGRGMDPDALHKAGHWGLLGMEERVRSHGGSISIDSVRAGGTSILVRIPLNP